MSTAVRENIHQPKTFTPEAMSALSRVNRVVRQLRAAGARIQAPQIDAPDVGLAIAVDHITAEQARQLGARIVRVPDAQVDYIVLDGVHVAWRRQ